MSFRQLVRDVSACVSLRWRALLLVASIPFMVQFGSLVLVWYFGRNAPAPDQTDPMGLLTAFHMLPRALTLSLLLLNAKVCPVFCSAIVAALLPLKGDTLCVAVVAWRVARRSLSLIGLAIVVFVGQLALSPTIIGGVVLGMFASTTAAAIMMDGMSLFGAMSKSFGVVEGNFRHVFVVYIVTRILALAGAILVLTADFDSTLMRLLAGRAVVSLGLAILVTFSSLCLCCIYARARNAVVIEPKAALHGA